MNWQTQESTYVYAAGFKNEDFWQGKWRITEQCKYALDKAEIEIPFPQMDVHMR